MKNRVTLINVISNFALQITTIICGFILPRIILSYFGSEVNGLVSSLNQFLSYITLIEGGVTSVVAANLYKPLVSKDDARISSVLVTAKRFYNTVGLIFIVYSLVLAIAYPIIFKTGFTRTYVAVLTIILSITLIVQYMFSLSLKTLLAADKKIYIVSLSQIIIIILNVIFAYLTVKIYPSIHILKLFTGLLFIIQPVVYGIYIKKNYNIDWKCKADDSLLSQRWNGLAINLAAFIHNCTDITVLTFFTNLQTVSVYSVYYLVTNGLSRLIQAITSAISPTVGHAYARNDINELHEKMDLYEFITFILVSFFFSIAGLLITPFVTLYTTGINDANYYQPLFGVLIVLSEALYLVKDPHLNLSYSANKFKELTWPAYTEAGINIIVSVILVNIIGLIGVTIGTITAMLFRMIFHIYFTTKIIPSRKQRIFYKKFSVFIVTTLVGVLVCKFAFPLTSISLGNWMIHGLLYSVIIGSLLLIISCLFFKKELLFFKKYLNKKK